MTRVIVLELRDDTEPEFAEILHELRPDRAGVWAVHVAIGDVADAVLAAMPHLKEPT